MQAGLRKVAHERPDTTFLKIEDATFTYQQALDRVLAVAEGIRRLGVVVGERVAIMAPNGPETVWAWIGAGFAHCVDVPLNTDARGASLAYLLRDSAPRIVIGTPEYLERIADCGYSPDVAVHIGPEPTAAFGPQTTQLSFDEFASASGAAELTDPRSDQTATILYTSGTTGPSKGVMIPHGYYPAHAAVGVELVGLTEGDTAYCVQPLFHIDARGFVNHAICSGTTVVLGTRFSASGLLGEVRRSGASVMNAVGTMLWMLFKQPPRADDRDHPLRLILSSSTPAEIHREFEARFGVEVVETYGMTEAGFVAATRRGNTSVGSIGWPVSLAQTAVVDEFDRPVATGEIGELVSRPTAPHTMMQGYWHKPDATVAAWRNLWFHTGDHVKLRDDGQLEYIGRKKDAIRRRGENISAWEVEQAAMRHPDVLEAAAFGVPSDVGEDDVAILVVVLASGMADADKLHAFLSRDLPRFAVPRYIEFVDALPKTPSERIAKGKVRERGITAAAWDAESSDRQSRTVRR